MICMHFANMVDYTCSLREDEVQVNGRHFVYLQLDHHLLGHPCRAARGMLTATVSALPPHDMLVYAVSLWNPAVVLKGM